MAETHKPMQKVLKQSKKLFCTSDFWLIENFLVPLHRELKTCMPME